jgi:hypothetical protein
MNADLNAVTANPKISILSEKPRQRIQRVAKVLCRSEVSERSAVSYFENQGSLEDSFRVKGSIAHTTMLPPFLKN